ncbi:TauD/TfdA family dioxygenase [Congregibacter brevis]|uniref:TauD/TfdA family dioxygenase n=1 Tax=Congregibacter brevis TaxID=3081201 RepID=A0ABZ0IGT4_9GAMM|nr:TauD/TfdA family dioxygenase [Congregibacter sp. IMCC45268]
MQSMTDFWSYVMPTRDAAVSFPCILGNGDEHSSGLGLEDTLLRIAQERGKLSGLLKEHGAILFRGMPLRSAVHFDAFIGAFELPNFRYADSLSNAVRTNRTDRVFTANEAPPTVEIFLHHEMAQTPVYPSKLFFFCETAPQCGGETPICRSDWLLELMREQQPQFLKRCDEEGLQYTNVMPQRADAGSGQGRSWTDTLGTHDRNVAEQRLLDLGYSWSWLPKGELKVTTPVLPAVKELANGTKVFFNQLIAAYRGWNDNRNKGEKSVTFGSGEEIPADDLALTAALAEQITEDVAWQQGDVVLIDNYMIMHGRRPFEGSRAVLASLVAAD